MEVEVIGIMNRSAFDNAIEKAAKGATVTLELPLDSDIPGSWIQEGTDMRFISLCVRRKHVRLKHVRSESVIYFGYISGTMLVFLVHFTGEKFDWLTLSHRHTRECAKILGADIPADAPTTEIMQLMRERLPYYLEERGFVQGARITTPAGNATVGGLLTPEDDWPKLGLTYDNVGEPCEYDALDITSQATPELPSSSN